MPRRPAGSMAHPGHQDLARGARAAPLAAGTPCRAPRGRPRQLQPASQEGTARVGRRARHRAGLPAHLRLLAQPHRGQFQALRRFALNGTDYRSHAEQDGAIHAYLRWHNRNARPAKPWRIKAEVHHSLPDVAAWGTSRLGAVERAPWAGAARGPAAAGAGRFRGPCPAGAAAGRVPGRPRSGGSARSPRCAARAPASNASSSVPHQGRTCTVFGHGQCTPRPFTTPRAPPRSVEGHRSPRVYPWDTPRSREERPHHELAA